MKKFLLLCFSFFLLVPVSQASDYKLDESSINTLFEAAEDVSVRTDITELALSQSENAVLRTDCDPLTSFLLCTFLGTWGIHRLYMGTDPVTFLLYVLTCGGCTIITLIDWIILLVGLVDNDISPYCNNPDLFMW